MIEGAKRRLRGFGAYPAARDLYRRLSPAHRRERRLRRDFFAQFLRPGDLCFDIGANVGQSIEAMRACGAAVLALEPNPACLPALQFQFGGDPMVTLVAEAVGAESGEATLHFSGTAATASLRADWNEADDEVHVTAVTTLEQLMDRHGTPRLLKVDVEGFEREVFRGLRRPVPVVYFEMHAAEPEAIEEILGRLGELGRVDGANAVSDDHGRWLLDEWVAADRLLPSLAPLPTVANVVVRMQ